MQLQLLLLVFFEILGYLSDHQETDRMISLQQLAENDTEAIRKWYAKAPVL